MIKVEKKENCCGCSACYSICPKKAIAMYIDDKGFSYPKVDRELCVNCGLCEKVCPILNEKNSIGNYISSYVGFYKNEQVRMMSSSGGLFSAISEYVLTRNGIVFGALFDDNFMVKHWYIDSKKDLYKLRGSKYLQSDIRIAYIKCKEFLELNKLVLFSGTECQIAGLKSFLGKKYENLITIDVLCHGVPSPKLWRKYLDEQKFEIKNINFRDKITGWKNFSLSINIGSLDKKSTYSSSHEEDPYMRLFLNNICLRDSCYNCRFKRLERNSDITLGDAWGINKYKSNLDDDKGTSIIITHSKIGEEIIRLMDDIVIENIDIDTILPPKSASRCSVLKHKNYDEFFMYLNDNNKKMKDYLSLIEISFIDKVLKKIKRIIKK